MEMETTLPSHSAHLLENEKCQPINSKPFNSMKHYISVDPFKSALRAFYNMITCNNMNQTLFCKE